MTIGEFSKFDSLDRDSKILKSCHATETVNWLVIEPGEGSWGELDYQGGHTGNVLDH